MNIVLDTNATDAITVDATAPDARSIMLASAASIAAFVVETEGKLADSGKAWGHALFTAVYADKVSSLDGLIGDSKVAAGWQSLTLTDAGKKAKARLEVYFSNARLVAERWEGMSDDQRREVLAGLSSIHYLAGQFRKADADAKKAADKAAKLAQAETDAAKAAAEANESGDAATLPEPLPAPANTGDVIANLTAFFSTMTLEEAEEVGPAVSAMMAAYDARVNALLESEPEAIAA